MPLRLKSLELHGYKTFAGRTFFEFASGITAIVGPNGAGKSNIADALRWVLGEQSYSLLRGKKTEDMIFSGSEHKPRAGMASAEITFDNSANWLPVDFSDVAIARHAYRDGHNEYLLNGQHVRLRDMNELLAASGLSERTYTIVGQGLVDASLALKADERRRLFEEAAGVGLYRVRREEAIKRLENTRRNLERVQDIMTELEPRIKTLERQARRAKEYDAARADLRVVLREWYGYHWHSAQRRLQEAHAHVRGAQARAEETRAAHRLAQGRNAQFREHVSSLRARLNAWHRELSELYQQRESVSRDLAILDERRRALVGAGTDLTGEQQALASEAQLARERLLEVEQEVRRHLAEFDDAKRELALARQAFAARQSGRGAVETELQAVRDLVGRLSGQKAETQARLDELVVRLDALGKRYAATDQSSKAALQDFQQAEQHQARALNEYHQSEKQLREHLTRLEQQRQVAAGAENLRRAGLEQLATLETRQSRLSAELEIILQAEQSLAGYADGARFLLDAARQARLKSRGALSSILDVPAELEIAITAALGDALDAVLLDEDQVELALQLLESGEPGRAAFLPLKGTRRKLLELIDVTDTLGIASELAQVPAELRPVMDALLGNTLIVATRAITLRLAPGIPAHARIVTLLGEVFRGDGLIVAGKATASSTLSRPRQKRELKESLADLSSRLGKTREAMEGTLKKLQSASVELSGMEASANELRRRADEAQSAEQRAALEVENRRRTLEWQEGRLVEIRKELSEAENERGQLRNLSEENSARLASALTDERRLSTSFSELSLDEVQAQSAYWSTRVAVGEQALGEAQFRQKERSDALLLLEKELAAARLKLAEAESALGPIDQDRIALISRESSLHARVRELQALAEPAEKELESAEVEESRLQAVEAEAQKALTIADRAVAQAEIEHVRREESLESLRARVVDDFGLVSFQYADTVEGPVPLPFEGLVEQLPVVTEIGPDLEDQLTQRRARLRRLGLINPEAAREFDSESERYSFMTAQVQDLRQAEADLRQVISELDDLTRQEFSKTYTAVDKQFRSIFTRLFGGGTAHLSLTDPQDLVETGIEIEARLPGRREQGLSLLSGGERSLTAIALVFALLKVSPTPVCVMDEVDAMLDEANVGRFRDLLMELSQETQFIIITHNRNTVQAADVIYGVTMGRDSTSQVMSLKLDEVSEEMLGSSRA
jgi:chromosome segregation protein